VRTFVVTGSASSGNKEGRKERECSHKQGQRYRLIRAPSPSAFTGISSTTATHPDSPYGGLIAPRKTDSLLRPDVR